MRFPIALRLIAATGFLSVVIIGLYGYNQYRSEYRALEDKFGLTLKHIAINASAEIKGKDHAKIKGPGDHAKKPFKRIKRHLRRVQKRNYLHPDHIYTFHPRGKNRLAFCVMLHKKPFVGDKYDVPEQNRPLVKRALAGEPVQTRIYADAHGMWISAFAPIRTKKGKVQGILAIDYNVDTFNRALQERVVDLLIQSAIILAIGLALIFVLAFRISRPIKHLSSAAQKIQSGDYTTQVNIRRHDELGDLARVFNEMAQSLGERFHMLKYISGHTKEMISRLLNKEISEEGEIKNLAILFSDIRGFTRFSENRAPEQVVEVLNRLFTVQSEIIERYGGNIDKYVGDEVIAVFDGPTRVSDSIYAALEIQRAIKELGTSDELPEKLAVGIGISLGDVVMGSIGSEARKDYTIIGSNVNLAARLCSSASAGDVLISSDMHRSTIRDQRIEHVLEFDPRGEVSLKGFSVPVHVFGVHYKATAAK